MPAPAFLGSLWRGLVYLLRDEFIVPDAAPLASPRTCEPGPGTLTVVDAAGKFSVAGGNLNVGTSGSGYPSALYGDLASVGSIGAMFQSFAATPGYALWGLAVSQAETPVWYLAVLNASTAHAFTRAPSFGVAVCSPFAAGDNGGGVIFTATAAFFVIRRAAAWHLGMFWDLDALGVTSGYPFWANSLNSQGAMTVDKVIQIDLTAHANHSPLGTDWTDPYALAIVHDTFTDSDGTLLTAHTPEVGGPWLAYFGYDAEIQSGTIGSPVGAGLAFPMMTAVADGIFDVQYESIPKDYDTVFFRWDGLNAYWGLYYEGGNIKLAEYPSGTVRGSTVQAKGAGDSLIVRLHGSDIRCFHRTSAGVYSTLTAYTSSYLASDVVFAVQIIKPTTVARITVYPIDITDHLPRGL